MVVLVPVELLVSLGIIVKVPGKLTGEALGKLVEVVGVDAEGVLGKPVEVLVDGEGVLGKSVEVVVVDADGVLVVAFEEDVVAAVEGVLVVDAIV